MFRSVCNTLCFTQTHICNVCDNCRLYRFNRNSRWWFCWPDVKSKRWSEWHISGGELFLQCSESCINLWPILCYSWLKDWWQTEGQLKLSEFLCCHLGKQLTYSKHSSTVCLIIHFVLDFLNGSSMSSLEHSSNWISLQLTIRDVSRSFEWLSVGENANNLMDKIWYISTDFHEVFHLFWKWTFILDTFSVVVFSNTRQLIPIFINSPTVRPPKPYRRHN